MFQISKSSPRLAAVDSTLLRCDDASNHHFSLDLDAANAKTCLYHDAAFIPPSPLASLRRPKPQILASSSQAVDETRAALLTLLESSERLAQKDAVSTGPEMGICLHRQLVNARARNASGRWLKQPRTGKTDDPSPTPCFGLAYGGTGAFYQEVQSQSRAAVIVLLRAFSCCMQSRAFANGNCHYVYFMLCC
eukprot:1898353-Pleurochrysis_carterae.AAC.2